MAARLVLKPRPRSHHFDALQPGILSGESVDKIFSDYRRHSRFDIPQMKRSRRASPPSDDNTYAEQSRERLLRLMRKRERRLAWWKEIERAPTAGVKPEVLITLTK